MSLKNRDEHNRWRNKTVAFRVSPEEDAQIEVAVKLTGLTKQDYITRRLLCTDVVVQVIRECTRHSATNLSLLWMSCGASKLVAAWMMS